MWFGHGQAGHAKSEEVPHLLLGPQLDHLSRVRFAVALAEAKFASNVTLSEKTFKNEDKGLEERNEPVFEDEDRGLVDLDRPLVALGGGRVVDVGLLSSTDAPSDRFKHSFIDHLEEDKACSRIENEL
jgi:hypothetical protein